MPLINDNDTPVRIDLPTPGEWVAVKPFFSARDNTRLQKRVVTGARISGQGQILGSDGKEGLEAEPALEGATYAALEIAIVQWSFDAEITPENIARLDTKSFNFLRKQLNEMYELDEDEQDESRGNSESSGAIPS